MEKITYVKSITYTAARENLASTMDKVCGNGGSVTITRSGKDRAVVILSLEEYEQLEATAHLLRSPENARRLLAAMGELTR
jgi:antitoxin YefM